MFNSAANTINPGEKIYIELNSQGKTLQFQLSKPQHIMGRDRAIADLNVPEDWQVMGRCQAILRYEGDNYRIYDGNGKEPSTNGIYANHTRITPEIGFLLRNGSEIKIGQNPNNLIELKYYNPADQVSINTNTPKSISLKNGAVSLGRDSGATLSLDSSIVSRRHATINSDAQGRYVLQDHSTNGVFVNGQKINGSTVLREGATVQIGTHTLVVRGDDLRVIDEGNQIRLDANKLLLKTNGKIRLDDISFGIEPGQFVALVGGSGAGKSTLMRTLLGLEQPTEGVVYLNGGDLRKNFNLYRTQIGYVPQDDIIHRDLTVAEVLTYAAKLRLPPDTDINSVVEKTLQDVEMSHRRSALISELSGGQRKRVSIGVELLADPKLFFLDEPTSGLDPGLDKKMMQLLRKLSNQGRTVILVTHATANIKLCDRVVFLGLGGRLCYFGSPDDCLAYFSVKEDFADIYNLLDKPDNVVDQANNFVHSNDYRRYVTNHLSIGNQSSQFNVGNQEGKSTFFAKQLSILTQRYFQIQKRDRINLALALLTAPIGISLINVALKDKIPFVIPEPLDPTQAPLALRVLFVFTCASLWVGLSTSLQEVIKEAAIYIRERLVNLSLLAYLGSKLVILGGLAFLQTILISLIILLFFKSPESNLISWQLGLVITTFLTLFASMNLGLMVSAIVKNGNQANSALPLLLIPQIIFSGVLFKMEGIASKISWFMLSRWSIGAYGTLVNVNGMVPEAAKLPDGSSIARPFEPTAVYDATWGNLTLNWQILCLHIAIYLGVTLYLQKRKDIF
ncbi:ATP-binding cassette domain-containing protein [Calothrix sp. PCC 6303]|uniref:ATP-binding cassette domain-containing protein n=1 Tax=Calothrix sp. PCC 6303 TaxID=1170562 RepID=UPI0002A00B4A|nr:ATP-binding cassette domain-containing protein [Calothrix sp. PCC 6303]AFZ04454.1 FHA modulated ABC efflux pump with fused ATPase and integral membrane subunits [Calothrix sp. PCC 6303]